MKRGGGGAFTILYKPLSILFTNWLRRITSLLHANRKEANCKEKIPPCSSSVVLSALRKCSAVDLTLGTHLYINPPSYTGLSSSVHDCQISRYLNYPDSKLSSSFSSQLVGYLVEIIISRYVGLVCKISRYPVRFHQPEDSHYAWTLSKISRTYFTSSSFKFRDQVMSSWSAIGNFVIISQIRNSGLFNNLEQMRTGLLSREVCSKEWSHGMRFPVNENGDYEAKGRGDEKGRWVKSLERTERMRLLISFVSWMSCWFV